MANESVEKREAASRDCSFCGRAEKEVKALVAGPKVNICDGCVELCNNIVGFQREKTEGEDPLVLRGSEVGALVAGFQAHQEQLKKTLSAAVELLLRW